VAKDKKPKVTDTKKKPSPARKQVTRTTNDASLSDEELRGVVGGALPRFTITKP